MIFILIFVYTLILFMWQLENAVRIWCSWCSIADFSSACTGSSPVIRYLDVYSTRIGGMFGHIVLWLLIMILGGAMIYFSANLVEMLWRSRRADDNLWWTRQMWMLIWFAWIVIWWLIMFWVVSLTDPTSVNASGF